jgi:hypothetical protein
MAPEQQSQEPLPGEEIDYPPDPDEAQNTDAPGDAKVAVDPRLLSTAQPSDKPPHVFRLRVATWDLVCTIALLALLLALATTTSWPTRLFGFLSDVCTGESCGPVPYGVDIYIYPVVWGGIGAAIAAAGIGPFVSLLKGWYMSFWPVLSLTILMVSSVTGDMLTIYSARYWL